MRIIRLIIFLVSLIYTLEATARYRVCCSPEDSIRIELLLKEAKKEKPIDATLYFAHKFIGVKYVGKTLDRNTEQEQVVVNLKEMDCTTYVETVMALVQTYKANSTAFTDYIKHLVSLRYEDGNVSYAKRNHYFTTWIDNAYACGKTTGLSDSINVKVFFMTRFPELYPQLKAHPELIAEIKAMEDRISGKKYPYIPKEKLVDKSLLRQAIRNGDIIAITTSKPGLDIAHVGFAVWHNDGIHLLNASQIHGKVVEEEIPLHTYIKKHPTQTGIRCISMQ